MTWKIETFSSAVDAELDGLDRDLLAKFAHVSNLLIQFSPQGVREPHVKPLIVEDAPLWEMRLSGKTKIARAVYVTQIGQRIVILHVFIKKTQKTPSQAIATALRRYQLLMQSSKETP
jgi:phage-related protein